MSHLSFLGQSGERLVNFIIFTKPLLVLLTISFVFPFSVFLLPISTLTFIIFFLLFTLDLIHFLVSQGGRVGF